MMASIFPMAFGSAQETAGLLVSRHGPDDRPTNLHGGLQAGLSPLRPGGATRRNCIRPRFRAFLEDLEITEDQADDGLTGYRGVVSCAHPRTWSSGSVAGCGQVARRSEPAGLPRACSLPGGDVPADSPDLEIRDRVEVSVFSPARSDRPLRSTFPHRLFTIRRDPAH